MELFGIYKSIEYMERELGNVEYAFTKEDIRKNGSNALIIMESILKELVHIYGYILFDKTYKNELGKITNIDDKIMFGTALNILAKLHSFLRDEKVKKRFASIFDRNYLVFKFNDRNYENLMECSRTRAKLLHDILSNNDTIEIYKQMTKEAIKKCLDVLKHFKEANIFPDLIYLEKYYLDGSTTVCHFANEIGAIIPIDISNCNIDSIKNTSWYFFKTSKKNILIPVNNKLNHLATTGNETINKISIDMDDTDETTVPMGFFLVEGCEERFPIIDDLLTIGRLETNNIVINRRSISRKHLIASVFENKLMIKDLNSKFGTLLNGVKLEPGMEYQLNVGDQIIIGLGLEELKLKYMK